MQPVALMITNGGPHPADKLAASTAWKIVDLVRISDDPIDPKLPDIDRGAIEANRETFRQARTAFEAAIAALLEKHHHDVQHHERGKLKEKGNARLEEDHDHEACGSGLCSEVVALTVGTVLQAHFARPETQARVIEILDSSLGHTAHIERSWHADRHPHDDHSKAFKARHHVETPAVPAA
ncbi:MAG: hypothetical protein E6G97_25960 [Alphaproteobacteria bacterium]|nr:MAG: hypothetical protein E6G97_25960 [Alphaproteobacteria bacterium]